MKRKTLALSVAGVITAAAISTPLWLNATTQATGSPLPSGAAVYDMQPVAAPDPKALFERWNDTLESADPAAITALYAPDAVLLPTASAQVRDTPAEIQDYFVHFMKARPSGELETSVVESAGPDHLVHLGTYTFTKGDGTEVQARYTYVYERIDGEWLIAHHHSSALPADHAAA